MKVIPVILTLFILITPSTSTADPSPEIEQLLNENVSMMDIGMYKMENSLMLFLTRINHTMGSVEILRFATYYDWSSNKIMITAQVIPQGGSREFPSKEDAKSNLSMTTQILFALVGNEISLFPHFFTHIGWSTDPEETIKLEHIANRIYFKLIANFITSEGDIEGLFCTYDIKGENKMWSD